MHKEITWQVIFIMNMSQLSHLNDIVHCIHVHHNIKCDIWQVIMKNVSCHIIMCLTLTWCFKPLFMCDECGYTANSSNIKNSLVNAEKSWHSNGYKIISCQTRRSRARRWCSKSRAPCQPRNSQSLNPTWQGESNGTEGHVILLRAPELGRAPELRLPEHRKSSRSSAISTVPTTS